MIVLNSLGEVRRMEDNKTDDKITISKELFNGLLQCKNIAEQTAKAKEDIPAACTQLAYVVQVYNKELKRQKISLPERVVLLCHLQNILIRGL